MRFVSSLNVRSAIDFTVSSFISVGQFGVGVWRGVNVVIKVTERVVDDCFVLVDGGEAGVFQCAERPAMFNGFAKCGVRTVLPMVDTFYRDIPAIFIPLRQSPSVLYIYFLIDHLLRGAKTP